MKVFIVTLILAFGYIVAGLSGSGSRSAVPQCPASGSPLTPSALEVAAACSAADLDYPIIRDVADSDCAMSGYGTANETCVVGLLKQDRVLPIWSHALLCPLPPKRLSEGE